MEDWHEFNFTIQEDYLSVLVVNEVKDRVLLTAFLNVNVRVLEHLLKRILVSLTGLVAWLLGLDVADTEEGGQELSVVHTSFDVEGIINGNVHAIDLVQWRLEPADELFSRMGQVHQLHEVEKALQWDHLIFLSVVEWAAHWCIVLEVVMQLQMEDWEERHRCIKVLFLL